jgi:16S rRNA (cytosine1402-N4)-methyltransferase
VSGNPRSRSAVLRVAERSDVAYTDQLMSAAQPQAAVRKAGGKPSGKPAAKGAGKPGAKPRGGRA